MQLFYVTAYSFKHNAYRRFIAAATDVSVYKYVEQWLDGDYQVEYVHAIRQARLQTSVQPFCQEL